jgi:arabinofuranosyltransferase
MLLLISSKAFIDFSTSGLENALSHLLLVVFIIVFFKQPIKEISFFWLFFVASLVALNRMDNFLLLLPALFFVLIKRFSKRDIAHALLGFMPFILWELFSLYYYGFLFPNTAYAKLNTGIANSLLLKQGFLYYLYTLSRDPASLILVFSGVLLSVVSKDHRKITLSIGIVLYSVYILRIGGDFMGSRFFSVLVLGAVAIIVDTNFRVDNKTAVLIALVLVFFYIITPHPPLEYNAGDSRQEANVMGTYNGINDERQWYYQLTGLLTMTRNKSMPRMAWASEGREARERGYSVVHKGPVGIFGYAAGPQVHVVDWFGLGDPLLARLHIADKQGWRIGHFYRELPDGYLETLEAGENLIADKNLAAYYEKLSILTRGDLSDFDRLSEIWKFNVGVYDPLVEAYHQNQ